YEVLGASVTRTVDVRVVSATNRDLADATARGTFREDLFYRLNLIAIQLPPLRSRREDIPVLARRFLEELGKRYGRGPIRTAASRHPGSAGSVIGRGPATSASFATCSSARSYWLRTTRWVRRTSGAPPREMDFRPRARARPRPPR